MHFDLNNETRVYQKSKEYKEINKYLAVYKTLINYVFRA